MQSNDSELVDVVANLASEFNTEAGHQGINIVEDEAQANSSIRFVPNLLEENHYLGYGVGLSRTVEGARSLKNITTIEKTDMVLYSMHLQFDENNFKSHAKAVLNATDDGESWDHLYHLFCHEVGHGVLLEHDESDVSNVMYPVIHKLERDEIDYQSFFSSINSFFSENQ